MIKDHFRKRLRERTPYNDVETFLMDIQNKMDSILELKKGSKELIHYPFLKRKFQTYPNSTILVISWMGIGVVTDNNYLITLYNI
jgi:hypothetical protein